MKTFLDRVFLSTLTNYMLGTYAWVTIVPPLNSRPRV